MADEKRSHADTGALHAIRDQGGTWSSANLTQPWDPKAGAKARKRIETLAKRTQKRGPLPLWSGYAELEDYPTRVGTSAERSSNEVRTPRQVGPFFTWLVCARRPAVVLEFGAAFGVSGMYWLAGLEANGAGHLLSFEPNLAWAEVAEENFSQVGTRYTLRAETFEENVERLEAEGVQVDIAYIDAIHTSEFVHAQLELVLRLAAPGCLVILDDIDFSDDMQQCWQTVAQDPRFAAAYQLAESHGIVELATP